MIGRAEVRIVVEACSDAFGTIKPVLIIKDGPDFYANKTVGTHFYPAFLTGVDPCVERGAIEL